MASITAVTLVIGSAPALAQRDDNKGTEFMLGFMSNNSGGPSLNIFITGDTATSGIVEIPGLEFSESFTVTQGAITPVSIPVAAMVAGNDAVTNLGVRVSAEAEIVVYGLNQKRYTTDAFLGLPTDILGAEHIVLAYQSPSPSEFLIVGVQDGTTVSITPSVVAGSRSAGVPYVISLDRFSTYQLQTSSGDLTGTIITSDQPVAVFGGNDCAGVGGGNCDHLAEHLPPTSTWGVNFLAVSMANLTSGDLFRVIARDDATDVLLDGSSQGVINRGQFLELDLASDSVHTIETTGPALVAQYAKGIDGYGPLMMLIPPTEQFLDKYTVTTPAETQQFPAFTNFINVVVRDSDVSSCSIDGGAYTATFTPIGTSGFSGALEAVEAGTHNLVCPNPFGAYSYGFASADSYGYPGGLSLEQIANEACELTPDRAFNPIGGEHTVTARLTESVVNPLAGVEVAFFVAGSNEAAEGTCSPNADCITGENGEISFTYSDSGGGGVDQITGSFLNSEEEIIACRPTPHALKFWDEDCNDNGVPDTCDLSCDDFGEACSEFECGESEDLDQNGVPDECVPVELIVHPPVEAAGWGEGVVTSNNDGLITVFLAAQDAGILIYQYTDPAEINTDAFEDPIATIPAPEGCSFDDLVLFDDTLVAAARRCGVAAFDVSTPSSPEPLGAFEAPTYAKDVAVFLPEGQETTGFAFVADYYEGLWIVQVTDPGGDLDFELSATLVPIGTGLEGSPIAVDVSIVDDGTRVYVYVAHTQGLSIVEVEFSQVEPVKVELAQVVGSCKTDKLDLDDDPVTDPVPQDVVVRRGLAYLPLWMDGLVVVDVSEPEALTGECSGEAVETDQAYYKATVSESGSILFASEGQCGLAAFEINGSGLDELDFSSLPIAGGFECPPLPAPPPGEAYDKSVAFAWGVHERDGTVAVAWGRMEPRGGGFQIVEITEDEPDSGGDEGAQTDNDLDGVADAEDNCLGIANADQTDSNLDGFGNACDADYDLSGSVGLSDFSIFSAAYGASSSDDHYDTRADHNADGNIGLLDFAVFSQRWGNPSGPSGLTCAGSVPCP